MVLVKDIEMRKQLRSTHTRCEHNLELINKWNSRLTNVSLPIFMQFKYVTCSTTLRKCFHNCFSKHFMTIHLQLIKNIDHRSALNGCRRKRNKNSTDDESNG